MLLVRHLLALPSSLLLLLLDHSAAAEAHDTNQQWPYNLPPHIKYYPEHEPIIKRNAELQEKLQSLPQTPIGIRKMSSDPNEKFMFEYWTFSDDHEILPIASSNYTHQCALDPALNLHEASTIKKALKFPRALLAAKAVFDKRDFTCPTGTYACTSINAPNSCCATGSTCQLIDDNGTGSVGCCPANESCGGDVSQCPDTYTSCPNQGGGCCLPGYACFDVGCVQTSTTVVTVVPTPTSISTPVTSVIGASTVTVTRTTIVTPPVESPTTSPSTTSSSTTSSSIPTSTTSILSDTTTTTIVTSTSSPSTIPPNSLVCSSGFKSCPASLGGGCCPTDRACGSQFCPAMSSTDSLSAPARPTSNSAATTTTTSFSSIPGATCPTGFYACSAYYGGGCCQTGRDCSVTNCPETASTTVVSESQGATVVAPQGSGITAVASALTGQCASGWNTCTGDGGGCCPIGYACGTSCTATATASNGATIGIGSTVGKIAPESRAGRNAIQRWSLVLGGFTFWLLNGFTT